MSISDNQSGDGSQTYQGLLEDIFIKTSFLSERVNSTCGYVIKTEHLCFIADAFDVRIDMLHSFDDIRDRFADLHQDDLQSQPLLKVTSNVWEIFNGRFEDAYKEIYDECIDDLLSGDMSAPIAASDIYIARGNTLQLLENWPEAIKCYNRVLVVNPENLDARLALSVCLYQTGQYSESVDILNSVVQHCLKLIDGKPSKAELKLAAAYINLGYILNAQGKSDESAVQFSKADEIANKFVTYCRNELIERKNIEGVYNGKIDLLRISGDVAQTTSLKCNIYTAIEFFSETVGLLECLHKAGRVQAAYDLCFFISDFGSAFIPQEAFPDLSKALKLHEKALQIAESLDAEEYPEAELIIARISIMIGQIHNINNDNYAVRETRGRENEPPYSLEYFQRAYKIFAQITQTDCSGLECEWITSHYLLARAYLRFKQYDDGIDLCHKAIEVTTQQTNTDPCRYEYDLAVSYHNMAKALSEAGSFEQAISYFDKAVEKFEMLAEKGYAESNNALAVTLKCFGYIYDKQDIIEEVIDKYKYATELMTRQVGAGDNELVDDLFVYSALVYKLLSEHVSLDCAVEYYLTKIDVLAMAVADGICAFTSILWRKYIEISQYYLKQKKYEQAAEYASKAISSEHDIDGLCFIDNEDMASAYRLRAKIYKKLGKKAEAKMDSMSAKKYRKLS